MTEKLEETIHENFKLNHDQKNANWYTKLTLISYQTGKNLKSDNKYLMHKQVFSSLLMDE